MPIGFTSDIRPLFRDSPDVDSMQGYGLDLSSYADVKARAAEICEALANGSMPCDEAWVARAQTRLSAISFSQKGTE
jgi:hypothetical protein